MTVKGPKYLNYPGNVEHMIGEKFLSPLFQLDGQAPLVAWVVTDAVYDPDVDKTHVELDVLQ